MQCNLFYYMREKKEHILNTINIWIITRDEITVPDKIKRQHYKGSIRASILKCIHRLRKTEKEIICFIPPESFVQTFFLCLTARFFKCMPACLIWTVSQTAVCWERQLWIVSPRLKIKPLLVPLLQLLHIKVGTKHQTTASSCFQDFLHVLQNFCCFTEASSNFILLLCTYAHVT